MNIAGQIYFSPSVLLCDLDLENKEQVLKAFEERIRHYYLMPIAELNVAKYAFAAGALELLLIDALARYSTGSTKKGDKRFETWCQKYLRLDVVVSDKLYVNFRHGLLHEGHIKNLGQFSYDEDFQKPVALVDDCIVVNPVRLQNSLEQYLEGFLVELNKDEKVYECFLKCMKKDFQKEINKLRKL
ncbi:MAG: hypothetical protein KDD36_11545 [Flavobacteriales bacterium]|nr:hypothetical protein [Flavobacteriales bacterium]